MVAILETIYDARAFEIENTRANNAELKLDRDKLAMPEFKNLWARINRRSAYVVDFDTDELIEKSIEKNFATELDTRSKVAVYVKLPSERY